MIVFKASPGLDLECWRPRRSPLAENRRPRWQGVESGGGEESSQRTTTRVEEEEEERPTLTRGVTRSQEPPVTKQRNHQKHQRGKKYLRVVQHTAPPQPRHSFLFHCQAKGASHKWLNGRHIAEGNVNMSFSFV